MELPGTIDLTEDRDFGGVINSKPTGLYKERMPWDDDRFYFQTSSTGTSIINNDFDTTISISSTTSNITSQTIASTSNNGLIRSINDTQSSIYTVKSYTIRNGVINSWTYEYDCNEPSGLPVKDSMDSLLGFIWDNLSTSLFDVKQFEWDVVFDVRSISEQGNIDTDFLYDWEQFEDDESIEDLKSSVRILEKLDLLLEESFTLLGSRSPIHDFDRSDVMGSVPFNIIRTEINGDNMWISSGTSTIISSA